MLNRTAILLGVTSLALCSCSRSPQTETPPPEPEKKTFGFTDTNIVVEAAELEASKEDSRALQADFNRDGLTDLAIVKKEGDAQNKVDIYIARKPDASAPPRPGDAVSEATEKYFRGGTIERPDEGRIIGIASESNGEFVNIIILVTHSNKPNDWIHYRNDGESFTEVEF